MPQPAFLEHLPVLISLAKSNQDSRAVLLQSVSNKIIKNLIEIGYNILKGTFQLSSKEISTLRVNKIDIKRLTSKTGSLKSKRRILLDNQELLQLILRVFVKIFK